MIKRKKTKHSQKIVNKILLLLLVVSIVPEALIMILACGIWSNTIVSKTDEVMESNMSMSQKSLEDYFTTYDNIIMGIYTDNQFVEYLKTMNMYDWKNKFLVKHKIEENFEEIGYLYPDLLGIGAYSKKKDLIFYDSESSMDSASVCFSKDNELWKDVVRETLDCTDTVYSDAIELEKDNGEKGFAVYLAHRLADMNNYSRGTEGSVIICLNEEKIRQVYASGITSDTQLSFLCNKDGMIVSCSKPEYIGRYLWKGKKDGKEEFHKAVEKTVSDNKMLNSSKCLVYSRDIAGSDFIQVSIQDKYALLKDLRYVIAIVVLVGAMTILVSSLLVVRFAERIESSIHKIISAMDQAYKGNYQVQIENNGEYEEFAQISRHFNYMVKQIEVSGRQEKQALIREKNAEITALEAQINPHFLYNTLDAINWMAIDNEQFRISKMLKELAIILRYSIQKSNSRVTLQSEIEYLKKYIFLQQQRFDYSFKCLLDIDSELMECKLNKLLFQPLIENAIIHGFPGDTGEDTIWIKAEREDEKRLKISVKDNGKGMDADMVKELNQFDYKNNTAENSIGIRNVFMRVKYYYGELGDFRVEADKNGTKVMLWIGYEL